MDRKQVFEALHRLVDEATAGMDNAHSIEIMEEMQSAIGMRVDGLAEESREEDESD